MNHGNPHLGLCGSEDLGNRHLIAACAAPHGTAGHARYGTHPRWSCRFATGAFPGRPGANIFNRLPPKVPRSHHQTMRHD